MRKIFLIGLKDVRLSFRDPTALLLMLLAPFLLTLGMGFVTGAIGGGGNTGLQKMPVLVVNRDAGELGQALVKVFQAPELAELVEPTLLDDPAAARRQVDDDQTSAAVIIPAGLTENIIPAAVPAAAEDAAAGEMRQIEVYTNPARPTSAGIIQTIVEEFMGRVEIGKIGGEVAIEQLLESGLLQPDPQALAAAGEALGKQIAGDEASFNAINIQKTRAVNEATQFNIMAYMAPGMALMFLMLTVAYGGRSLLTERAQGTLPRLLVSPTAVPQILAGKVLGIYLTGVAQIAILVVASSLLFGLKWGDPLGLAALILAVVFGATGWGVLLTTLVRTPGQAANLGTALTLIFGILGGSFISLDNLPQAVQFASKITPNAWGLEGFITLALGGRLGDLGGTLLGLMIMGGALFILGMLTFNRRAILQK